MRIELTHLASETSALSTELRGRGGISMIVVSTQRLMTVRGMAPNFRSFRVNRCVGEGSGEENRSDDRSNNSHDDRNCEDVAVYDA